ncbi:MAG: molecular chaperone DnaK [Candidatus Sumerlaeaceae bacterium]|nr:molecular chaperone DnaK [Candidatus Sumerlaeaceae bacterium]
MERIVGIDLGTTNSVVAYYEQGQTIVIPNSEGSHTTPSVVLFKSPEEIIVGELAKRQLVTSPKQAIRSVKRFMGARFSEIDGKRAGIDYDLIEGPGDSILIDVGWARVSPVQVSAAVLRKMKSTAEDYFSEPVTKAVITVPAYFNDNQRAATKSAAEIAGLEVMRIINEPTAAALAYGLDKQVNQRISVFDFGGGTFDVSVLELDKDVFEVKATCGDTFLGGDNIDEILFVYVAERFLRETSIDLRLDPQAVQRLREAVEKVKCELSTTTESLVSLPFISANAAGPVHLNYPINRKLFNELIQPILPRLEECCNFATVDAGLNASDFKSVLLVGGSTRIPAVQNLVRDIFKQEPNRSLNPDEAVAVGAAIQASIMTGSLREVLLLDVTPLSLGIELAGGMFTVLVPRNSSIPTSVHKHFTTVKDNQTTVKVHVLQGERKVATENHTLGHFKLTNITPAPSGIPEINVRFQIDANGILQVSATDATSGTTSSVTIESYGNLSQQEVEQVISMAASSADDDRLFLRKAYMRTHADVLMGQFRKILQDTKDPLDPAMTMALKEAMFKFDIAMSTKDFPEIEMAFARLKDLANEMGERIIMQQIDPGSG